MNTRRWTKRPDPTPPKDGLPHDWATERAVVGGCILAPTVHAEVRATVDPEIFSHVHLRRLWQLMGELADRGEPPDLSTVLGECEARGFDDYGGAGAVVALPGACVQVDHVPAQIRRLARIHARRVGILAVQAALESLTDPSADVGAVTASLTETMQGLTLGTERGWTPLALAADDEIQRMQRGADAGVVAERVTTGIHELDQKLRMEAGDMVVIAARPGMGKTALVLQIAEHVAEYHGAVGVLSLEMGAAQLAGRTLARTGGVSYGKVRDPHTLNEAEIGRLLAASDRLHTLPLYVDDSARLTAELLAAKVRELKKQRPDLRCVVLDYLQLMETDARDGQNQVHAIGALTRSFKVLCRELGLVGLLLSQLSRKVEERPNKKPIPSDLRDSGAIEQDADAILMIYRDEVYHGPMSTDRGMATLILGKQRGGETGEVSVPFDGAYQRFGQVHRNAQVYRMPMVDR